MPASPGPRWEMLSRVRRTRARSSGPSPSRATIPVIPHIRELALSDRPFETFNVAVEFQVGCSCPGARELTPRLVAVVHTGPGPLNDRTCAEPSRVRWRKWEDDTA